MSSWLTPERIAEMQKWLLEHPIDHKYDEMVISWTALHRLPSLPLAPHIML